MAEQTGVATAIQSANVAYNPNVELSQEVRIKVEGDNLGQIAVGRNITQVGSVHGDYVVVNYEGEIDSPRPRTRPIERRSRDFSALLGRRETIRTARGAIHARQPVEFYAPPGMGKSALLRHLAHRLPGLPDGILCLSAADRPLADLQEKLFDGFFETRLPVKLYSAELAGYLNDIEALLVLDDVAFSREEIERLMTAMPRSVFLLAAEERRLWGEGRPIALTGLTPDEGVELFARELGRPLTADEIPAVRRMCLDLNGSPLAIIQAAALAGRERDKPPAAGLAALGGGASTQAVAAGAVSGLSPQANDAVAALASLNGAPLHHQHLAAVLGVADAQPLLRDLESRGVVEETDSGRFRAVGGVAAAFTGASLNPWREKLAARLADWAQANRQDSALVLRDSDAVRALIDWAAAEGRHHGVIRLARAIEAPLTLDKQWSAWADVIEKARLAAESAGSKSGEAWALHQQGTRALVEGRPDEARAALQEALDIRRAIGDPVGAELTRYHLDLLWLPPPPPSNGSGGVEWIGWSGTSGKLIGLLLGLIVLAGLSLIGWWAAGELSGAAPLSAQLPSPFPTPIVLATTPPSVTPSTTLTVEAPSTSPPINQTPVVSIISPTAGGEFEPGTLVRFAATANDSEDGPVGGSLRWFSDRDGMIAVGESFQYDVSNLTAGQHRITVQAGDSLGGVGEASIDIFVREALPPPTVLPNTVPPPTVPPPTFPPSPTDTVPPPVVIITSPAQREFQAGEPIIFAAEVTAAAPKGVVLTLVWTLDDGRIIGNLPTFETELEPRLEPYTVTVSLMESDRLVSQAESSFRVIGDPDLTALLFQSGDTTFGNGFSSTPVILAIQNVGTGEAGPFKVSARYQDMSTGQIGVAQLLTSQGDGSFLSVTEPFPPGSASLDGIIIAPIFRGNFGGEIRIWIRVDSCDGEGISDAIPCAVEETNENNNDSPAIVIAFPTPTLTPTDIPTPIPTPIPTITLTISMPVVTINSPLETDVYRADEAIVFSAIVSPDDLAKDLVWKLDNEEEIGRGPSINRVLEPRSRRYIVTASVEDSAGNTGQDSVTFAVMVSSPTPIITEEPVEID